MNPRIQSLLVIIGLLAASTALHAEVVGRVILAVGETTALRANQLIRLQRDSAVEDRDTLTTGASSNLQVRFIDKSTVSLRDQSSLKIEEYRYAGGEDATSKAFFELLKGGLRTVTGLIGRVNHENYGVKTATATIGIRGTHYALLLCAAGSCHNVDGSVARDGLYGSVSGGIISARNNIGEAQFGTGDYFFAPSLNQPVQKLIGPPNFFSDQLAGQNRNKGKTTAAQAGTQGPGTEQGEGNVGVQSGGTASDSRPNTLVAPPAPPVFVVTENSVPATSGTSQPALLQTAIATTTITTLPPVTGFFVGYQFGSFPGTGQTVFCNPTSCAPVTSNSANQLLSYGTLGTFPAGSLGAGTITGSFTQTFPDGLVVVGGHWNNAQITPNIGSSTPSIGFFTTPVSGPTFTGGAEFVTVTGIIGSSSLPTSGIVNYQFLFGTKGSTFKGDLGSGVVGSSATINFSTQSITLGTITLNFPTVGSFGPANLTFTGSGGRASGFFTGDFAGSLVGTCTGTGCTSSTVSGGFEGGVTGQTLATRTEALGISGGLANAKFYCQVGFTALYGQTPTTPSAPVSLPSPTRFLASYIFGTSPGTFEFTGGRTASGTRVPFTVDSSNNLTSYGTIGTFPAGSLGGGTIMESKTVTFPDGFAATVGRWTGTTQITASNNTTFSALPSGLLFLTANPQDVRPNSGTATYAFKGGPSAVDVLGNVGTITSGGTITVDFGAQSLGLSGLAINFPSVSGGGSAAFSLNGSATGKSSGPLGFQGPLSGSCSGTGCSPTTLTGTLRADTTGATLATGFEALVLSGSVNGTTAGNVQFLGGYGATSNSGIVTAKATALAYAGSTFSENQAFQNGITLSGNSIIAYSNSFQGISGATTSISGTLGSGTVVESDASPTTFATGFTLTDAAAAGNIHWGRWTGTFSVTTSTAGTQTPPTGVPYAYGDNAINIPATGSFIYNYIGGPSPTDTTGVSGTFNSGSLAVDFGKGSVNINTPLSLSVGSRNYAMTACTGCSFGGQTLNFSGLSGTCTGGACGTGTPASASGFGNGRFTGAGATGLVLSGTVFVPSILTAVPVTAVPTVAFAGAFKR
jgi:hypothetical protein